MEDLLTQEELDKIYARMLTKLNVMCQAGRTVFTLNIPHSIKPKGSVHQLCAFLVEEGHDATIEKREPKHDTLVIRFKRFLPIWRVYV